MQRNPTNSPSNHFHLFSSKIAQKLHFYPPITCFILLSIPANYSLSKIHLFSPINLQSIALKSSQVNANPTSNPFHATFQNEVNHPTNHHFYPLLLYIYSNHSIDCPSGNQTSGCTPTLSHDSHDYLSPMPLVITNILYSTAQLTQATPHNIDIFILGIPFDGMQWQYSWAPCSKNVRWKRRTYQLEGLCCQWLIPPPVNLWDKSLSLFTLLPAQEMEWALVDKLARSDFTWPLEDSGVTAPDSQFNWVEGSPLCFGRLLADNLGLIQPESFAVCLHQKVIINQSYPWLLSAPSPVTCHSRPWVVRDSGGEMRWIQLHCLHCLTKPTNLLKWRNLKNQKVRWKTGRWRFEKRFINSSF